MNHRICAFALLAAAGLWADTVTAVEPPWGDGYPEFLPDTKALHDRLPHEHPSLDHESPLPEDAETAPLVPIETVYPEFPHTALEDRRNGWVFLEFVVGKDGKPRDIRILAQDYQEIFGEKAKRAVARWRFKPATVNGEPIDSVATLPMEFRRPGVCCGDHRLDDASLDSPLMLPVQASGGLERADIVFLPMFDNLFGSPELAYIHAQKWVAGDRIHLSLEGMSGDLAIMWPKGDASTVEISPAMARIARVVPFALSGETARFTDAAGRTLVLVYADRESTIRGESAVGSVTMHHRVDLPGAGFYWVEFRKGADGEYESVMVNDVEQAHLTLQER